MRVKTTVYVPCRNYGRFLREAIESVVAQSTDDWELIVIGDGPEDETAAVAESFVEAQPKRIRYFEHKEPRGLRACANHALDLARGDYVMRLDADDYLDENALLVLSNYLDRHPDVALVYPNYTYIDEAGRFLGLERRKKVGDEARLLDLPAHGACTMVRKRALKSVGGYDEVYSAQDGHELWLKVLHRYQVANVSTPLFFYRQHGASMSNDQERLLAARRQIKRDLVRRQEGRVAPRIVALIPAKNTYEHLPNVVTESLAGRPLLEYALAAAEGVEGLAQVVVTTDADDVADYCAGREGVLTLRRPIALSHPRVTISQVVDHAARELETGHEIFPDIVALLSVHSPLRRAEHVRMAIDTLLLYNADSVLSVYEDFDLHFMHGAEGLEPLNEAMLQRLRLEREALYVDNGAIKIMWREAITPDGLLGARIGHTVMSRSDSLQIKSREDFRMARHLLEREGSTP